MPNISISLNEKNHQYLDAQVQNRSAYINKLIEQDRKLNFEAAMKAGYIEQSQDTDIQEDDQLWEVSLNDGLNED